MPDLKVLSELALFSSSGRLFHNFGAAALNALSPYVDCLVLGILKLLLVADLRVLFGVYFWRRSLIYCGAMSCNAL